MGDAIIAEDVVELEELEDGFSGFGSVVISGGTVGGSTGGPTGGGTPSQARPPARTTPTRTAPPPSVVVNEVGAVRVENWLREVAVNVSISVLPLLTLVTTVTPSVLFAIGEFDPEEVAGRDAIWIMWHDRTKTPQRRI
jgi:hypothetical protein